MGTHSENTAKLPTIKTESVPTIDQNDRPPSFRIAAHDGPEYAIYVQEPRGEDFSRFFGNILEDIARDWGTDVEDLPRLDPALVKRLRDAFRKNPRSLRRLKSLTQDLLDWEARMQQASAAGPSWIQ